ncbi:hypothetical protein BJN45_05600 [Azonexus hydrophilus]|uniref:DUF4258 domain-containing protein n=1 Tax=Azonexus hydrophilus TaxID=418702 RepID=A0A1R1I7F9_9RHOO|nr:hypothetical protein BJN45_05600 [Azonexus hydrophilus]
MSSYKSLSDFEVLQDVRALVRRNRIRFTVHAEERMAERGFDRSQVRDCLSSGFFVERPSLPNRNGVVEYKFNMQAVIDGDTMQVVASLRPDENVVVITVIDSN